MGNEPGKVAIAGDWHSNDAWACEITRLAAEALKGEDRKIILQLGDFGYWPKDGGDFYLQRLSKTLKMAGAEVWFIDGNHEDHPSLAKCLNRRDKTGRVPVGERIYWLPRGLKWTWHDRAWVALGGARSIDKDLRREGRDWFPEEAITQEQAAQVKNLGHADVMLTHDCASSVNLHLPPPTDLAWLQQVRSCEQHREILDDVIRTLQPGWLMHGHYHMCYSKPVQMPYGTLISTGLACDGMEGNWVTLDVKAMKWN